MHKLWYHHRVTPRQTEVNFNACGHGNPDELERSHSAADSAMTVSSVTVVRVATVEPMPESTANGTIRHTRRQQRQWMWTMRFRVLLLNRTGNQGCNGSQETFIFKTKK